MQQLTPTVQTSFAETYATAYRTLSEVPVGFGLATTPHCEPFQCSIRVCLEEALLKLPTAQASFVEMAVTPLRTLPVDPMGFGLLTRLQAPQVNAAAWATWAVRNRVVRTVTKMHDTRRIFKCFKVLFMRIFLLSFFESSCSVWVPLSCSGHLSSPCS